MTAKKSYTSNSNSSNNASKGNGNTEYFTANISTLMFFNGVTDNGRLELSYSQGTKYPGDKRDEMQYVNVNAGLAKKLEGNQSVFEDMGEKDKLRMVCTVSVFSTKASVNGNHANLTHYGRIVDISQLVINGDEYDVDVQEKEYNGDSDR